MSKNRFSNSELQKEYEHLSFLLKSNKLTVCVMEEKEKGSTLVRLFVRPVETSKRKTDFIGFVPEEIYWELKNEDREVCSKVITQAINGLHWKCSKGYCRDNCTEYYIKPDWKYWYSLRS